MNWNSLDNLRVSTAAVERFSPSNTRIVIVDNGSDDGSVEWLAANRRYRSILLDTNYSHGAALDLGIMAARTEYIVALDVDAFPIRAGWLETLIGFVAGGGAHVAGAQGGEVLDRLTPIPSPFAAGRSYVHPCCLAMRLRRFVLQRHTFRPVHAEQLDVGELISKRERGHLAFLPPTSTVGPGALGTVFGDIVYHNFYGTRHRRQGRVVDGIDVGEARRVWAQSVERYLGRDLT